MSDHLKLIEEFYSKPFYLSYSGLNKLLYSPGLFYRHYILQQKEEKLDSYLVDGKVIHCLLLDDGSFDDQFMLMPESLPTGNTRSVVDRIFGIYTEDLKKDIERSGELSIWQTEILSILKEIKLHQSLKTDVQRIDKIITDETKAYWEFLKIRGNKTLIDSQTLQRCREDVEVLRENSVVSELLGLFTHEMQNVNIYNEIQLTVETDKSFGLKGIIDNVKIDYDNKTIFVNDLKTTGKTIEDFPETIKVYNYWVQAAIYERLVRFEYDNILTSEWRVQITFIVIDKYQQVYPFVVSPETMKQWQQDLEIKLNEADWHYKERNYTLPYQFATGSVIL
jgi:hypothetical protein